MFSNFHLFNYTGRMDSIASLDSEKIEKYRAVAELPEDVNRLLYVRNLPLKVTSDQVYQLFGKFGYVYRIWVGRANVTRGSAYVMYASILDAKEAVSQLNNLKIGSRHLSVVYFSKGKLEKSTQARLKKQLVLEKQAEVFAD
ncbi:Nucleotide-binding alpha-beta plait [Perkinsela sp. CCAP 1560/4]|nr:Nucleotide-binding alpha-beta plait [Perkinsela sp. CCAP 1560/4]|eukprot:KNH05494.1 Nucleotide-binding alpha-beta plait [Perkinsela sp. CCAP 1560/4]